MKREILYRTEKEVRLWTLGETGGANSLDRTGQVRARTETRGASGAIA